MTKLELVSAVAGATELSKKCAGEVVDTVLAEITKALVAGENVTFTGFGTFKVNERAARTGRNPQTGETIQIPASKAVTFKAGKTLKDSVKNA